MVCLFKNFKCQILFQHSSHHQLQYALGSFGLITQAHASMYVSTLIQVIISCSTHWAPLVDNTRTCLHVCFNCNSSHHQLQYALGSFGLRTAADDDLFQHHLQYLCKYHLFLLKSNIDKLK